MGLISKGIGFILGHFLSTQVTALLKAGFKMNYFSLPAAENAVDLILEDRDQVKISLNRIASVNDAKFYVEDSPSTSSDI